MNTNNSDTPRTDEREVISEGLHEGWGLALARQLERELNEAKAELARRDAVDFPRVIQEMHGESAMLEQELAKVTKQFGNLHEALTRIDSECRKPEPHLPTIIAAASVALLRVKEEPEV